MEKSGLKKRKIGFVGAGNVATHLACNLHAKGHFIKAILSKNRENAVALASKTGAEALSDIKGMPHDLDFIIIATTDNAIEQISNELPPSDAIVMHTSGSTPLEVLSRFHKMAAVFYPFQTFSKGIPVDISEVPFFLEASDPHTLTDVEEFAHELSDNVFKIDSGTRAVLHIAGVLSSNFTVYLMEMARKVLSDCNLDLETMRPLALTSLAKAFSEGPMNALTGPARRGDIEVVERQSAYFSDPFDKSIYDAFSLAILNKFKNKSF